MFVNSKTYKNSAVSDEHMFVLELFLYENMTVLTRKYDGFDHYFRGVRYASITVLC